MNKPDYLISTPENVDLHLELAGVGSRIWAAFIDMLIVYAGITTVILFALLAVYIIGVIDVAADAKSILYYYVVGIAILFVFVLQFGYFIFDLSIFVINKFNRTLSPQTPGNPFYSISASFRPLI